MQLHHYANTPWRTISFTLEILDALRMGDPRRLTELQYIAALLNNDYDRADAIAASV